MKRANLNFIAAVFAAAVMSACGSGADTSDGSGSGTLKTESEALISSETFASETETAEETSEKSETETETETAEETSPADDGWAVYDGCGLKLNGASLVTDYNGEPAVVLEMQFKNDSDESASCGFTFNVDVYQDGI